MDDQEELTEFDSADVDWKATAEELYRQNNRLRALLSLCTTLDAPEDHG
jgi:hypothetical protein